MSMYDAEHVALHMAIDYPLPNKPDLEAISVRHFLEVTQMNMCG